MATLNTIIGLLIIFSIKLTNSSLMTDYNRNKFTCPDSTECSCSYLYGEYELNCPVSNPSITIKINPELRLQMDCDGSSDENKYSLLPKMNIGDVPTVQITRCPLPKAQPILSILNHLGVKKIRALFFRSYGANLGMSLVNQHLKGLTDLERLYLSGNGLTDLSEDLFSDLTNLIWLDLQGNKVHLPRDIFVKLDKLESLELGYNNLENLEPGVFRNQHRLKLLNLWGNKLKNLTKDSFNGLNSIRELDLSSSEIETFESEVFGLLTNLTILNLSGNKLKQLPSKLLENNKQLIRLKLINNRVPLENLPDDFLSNLPNLEEVFIQSGLTAVTNQLFTGSVNLRNITLSNNQIESLPINLLSDQTHLLDFDLSHNKLTELNDDLFRNTHELLALRLSYNKLYNISGKVFEKLRNLKELYINDNNLHHIEQHAFAQTRSLKIVKLDNNYLTLMDRDITIEDVLIEELLASPFQSLLQLEILGLRNNKITYIFQDWQFIAVNLKELDLSFNNISRISYTDLQFLAKEILVNLTNNNIFEINLRELEGRASVLDEYRMEKTSTTVLIDSNPLVCDCVILHFIQYLRHELTLKAQNLINIVPGNLQCISPPSLEKELAINLRPDQLLCPLDAESSTIKLCPENCSCMVRSSDRAVIVNCSNKNLTMVPDLPYIIDHGLSFIELYIDNNSITELPMNDSKAYSLVKEIHAENNCIKYVDTRNLPPNLTILELANNEIESINRSVLTSINKTRSLISLTFRGNPWKCDCDTLDLLLFMQNHYKIITDYLNVTCIQGGSISTLSPSDFCADNTDLIIAISCSIAVLGVVIGIIAALYYKYQQEVKVFLFAHNLCLWFVTEEELDKNKKFDAFISYSHKDEEFVTEHLVPKLETGTHPFKLCLHIRDWIVGEWIPTQIAKSVDESRRTVVILSPNFLESVWGRMEFRTAHNNALSEGRARVIVIIYGDIGDTNNLDPELRAYLNMNTYVKWGDPWFWDKLRYAMPHPTGPKPMKLFKGEIRNSVDDKLELIMPSPSTPPLTTPPAETAGHNPMLMNNKLMNGGEINQNGKLNGLNGHVNGAFIINTNSKQSDV